ncbi:MAG: hypothetical protein ACLPX9_03170 [Rhodomicrobium sp.]
MTKEFARSGHCKVPGKPSGSIIMLLSIMAGASEDIGSPPANYYGKQHVFLMLPIEPSDDVDDYQIVART